MSSFLTLVSEAPPIPIFDLTARYKKDTHPQKMNLGVGAYQDDAGKPWVLPVVKQMEERLNAQLQAGQLDKEYLPVTGLPAFVAASAELALGADHPLLASGRVVGAQCLSGTGSLRVACEFIAAHSPCKDIYVSDPSWDNHQAIFAAAGLRGHAHRYYDAATHGLDMAGLLADVAAMPAGATLVLHACAHNPTGVDPTPEQWLAIAAAVRARGLFVLLDSAYQGFASGDPDRDAAAVRALAAADVPMLVCQSYAKNFGLYAERVGCLLVVADSPAAARASLSRLALLIRTNWSSPPVHGALVVAGVLRDGELRAAWHDNIRTMAARIARMRRRVYDALVARRCPGSWTHILDQIGMFSYTGLTPPQVAVLVDKYHIYLPASGRINMCGVTDPLVDYLADAIVDAVTHHA